MPPQIYTAKHNGREHVCFTMMEVRVWLEKQAGMSVKIGTRQTGAHTYDAFVIE